MPRYRATAVPAATLVGRLLILIASGRENSRSLSKTLGVSVRQINRYVQHLNLAGWRIERVGEWLKHDYFFDLKSPRIVIPTERKSAKPKKVSRKRGK